MKKIIAFAIASFVIAYCQGQERDEGRGISFSYSTNHVFAFDMFAREGNNRIHFGFGYQFNGQKTEIKLKQNEIDLLTVDRKGDYFWVIDLGYSRIFMKKITVHPECSIGAKKEYTNFKDNKYIGDGHSLITSSKAVIGVGLNVGYFMNSGFEPFLGLHTLKKVNFGVRLNW